MQLSTSASNHEKLFSQHTVQMSRARSWCFTLNNYTAEEMENLKNLECTYIIYGEEVGEQGTPHLQGYIYLKNGKTLQAMKKFMGLPRVHLEVAKGSPEQNKTYCSKQNLSFEKGDIGHQGKRSDLDGIKERINDGKSNMRDILAEANSYQSVRFAEKLMVYSERGRDWETEVTWIYGPTGTGKTKLVHDICSANGYDLYVCQDSAQWWDGYDGHDTVLIDDFRPDFIKYKDLLRLLDRYNYRVAYKGGFRQLLAKRIFITAPHPPDYWYNTDNFVEDNEQLLRRINYTIKKSNITIQHAILPPYNSIDPTHPCQTPFSSTEAA